MRHRSIVLPLVLLAAGMAAVRPVNAYTIQWLDTSDPSLRAYARLEYDGGDGEDESAIERWEHGYAIAAEADLYRNTEFADSRTDWNGIRLHSKRVDTGSTYRATCEGSAWRDFRIVADAGDDAGALVNFELGFAYTAQVGSYACLEDGYDFTWRVAIGLDESDPMSVFEHETSSSEGWNAGSVSSDLAVGTTYRAWFSTSLDDRMLLYDGATSQPRVELTWNDGTAEQVQDVPEPSTLVLLGAFLAGARAIRFRRRPR